jgi:hypothetical protein
MLDGRLIRFVTARRHPPYGHRTGLFQVAYAMRREEVLDGATQEELRGLLQWFGDHLARPERFTRSRYPRAQNTAVCWIRAEAQEHIRRLRRLAALLEAAGIPVEELRTGRPGYVVYRDAAQVVALPFADTPR